MASIFSTQNLQTFLRRKYLRPPSRPPGPPGRGGRRSPRSPPPNEGRSPEGRSPPAGRSPPELGAVVALVSSAMMLLKNRSLVFGRRSFGFLPQSSAMQSSAGAEANNERRTANDPGRLRCYFCRFSASFCSRGRNWRGWRGLAFGVADGLDLVQALLLLVDANRDELDHRFGDAQAALQFVNQPAGALHGKQHIDAIVKPADHVGQAALAHFLYALHVSARGRNRGFKRRNQLVLFFFRHVGADNKHQLISAIHFLSIHHIRFCVVAGDSPAALTIEPRGRVA